MQQWCLFAQGCKFWDDKITGSFARFGFGSGVVFSYSESGVFESALLSRLLVLYVQYLYSLSIYSSTHPRRLPRRRRMPSAMSMRNSRLRHSCFARSFVRSFVRREFLYLEGGLFAGGRRAVEWDGG